MYDYGGAVEEARASAEQKLRDHPDLDGALDTLAVHDLPVTDAGLTVVALASGRLEVLLHELRDPPDPPPTNPTLP